MNVRKREQTYPSSKGGRILQRRLTHASFEFAICFAQKAKTGEGVVAGSACRRDAGLIISDYGEDIGWMRRNHLCETLEIVSEIQPPRLYELLREFARRDLKNFKASKFQLARGARESISMVPARVLELVDISQRRLLEDAYNGGLPMNYVQCVHALKELGWIKR